MNSAGISHKEVDMFLKQPGGSYEVKSSSPTPSAAICPKHQVESFMVINLPQVVRSIILIDPGYILAEIIQSFPVGT